MRLGLLLSLTLTFGMVLYILSSLYILPTDIGIGVDVLDREVLLPLPVKMTTLTVEEAILLRKSIREWSDEALTVNQLSMILWASQGVVEDIHGWLRRASPSAGATYPLEIYVVVGDRGVYLGDGRYLQAGVYKYDYRRHSLRIVVSGDMRERLWRASLMQDWVRDAPVSIVVCAVYERTTSRYGDRGVRYVILEAGHVGQNIYLMATALGLGTVAIGAFYDDEVANAIKALKNEKPLYIFPVGVPLTPHKMSFEDLSNTYSRLRR